MPIDMSAATAPKAPPRRSRSTSTPATFVPPQSNVERRTEGLNGLGQMAQGLALLMGQYADAATIGTHVPNITPELAKIAETTEWLAKPIDLMIEIGPFGALIAALLPFGMQLAANHKLIDASNLIGSNVVPPEVLESQMKAQVLRMQADAMRQQQQAVEEAKAAQAQYAEYMKASESQ